MKKCAEMTYMIISDIHGSEIALKRALDQYERLGCNGLIILGDVLYHGPRNPLPEGHNPKGVAELLNQYSTEIIAVRGNCEAEVDQMVLDFPCMSDYVLILDNDYRIFATHGHIYNPNQLPKAFSEGIFLFGHTHLWELRIDKNMMICNPGSIALPKEGRLPTFAIYSGGKIVMYTLYGEVIFEKSF